MTGCVMGLKYVGRRPIIIIIIIIIKWSLESDCINWSYYS
jgi:hypothetical protein